MERGRRMPQPARRPARSYSGTAGLCALLAARAAPARRRGHRTGCHAQAAGGPAAALAALEVGGRRPASRGGAQPAPVQPQGFMHGSGRLALRAVQRDGGKLVRRRAAARRLPAWQRSSPGPAGSCRREAGTARASAGSRPVGRLGEGARSLIGWAVLSAFAATLRARDFRSWVPTAAPVGPSPNSLRHRSDHAETPVWPMFARQP